MMQKVRDKYQQIGGKNIYSIGKDEGKIVKKGGGTIIIVDWCANYTIVRIYHLLFERMRWNWRRFGHEYPSPLISVELVNLVESIPGLQVIQHSCYQVRVFSIFHWGMQSIIIQRIN